MVEFNDLFDNEDDVFQKKAKVMSTSKSSNLQTRLPLATTKQLQTDPLKHADC